MGQILRKKSAKSKKEKLPGTFINGNKEKKYSSIFEVKDKLSFNGGPDLSEKIDEIVYGESGSAKSIKKRQR